MRRTDVLAEYASQPGTYLLGEGYVCFHRDASLYGFALFGDHDERTISKMAPILDAQLDHAPGPHGAISDLSRLGRFDVAAYVPLANQLASRVARLGTLVRQHVLIRPGGASGIMVSGFYGVARPPYPFTVVADAAEAAAELKDPGVVDLLAEVHLIIDDASRPSETARLRELFRTSVSIPDVDEAARALGTSSRTLQRRLQEEGASFREERAVAQIERAKHLLLTTDDKITAIAVAVGFTSLANFSAAFQRETGESPKVWRTRHRS